MWYEVDLRNRKTGSSVECIYSGEDYEKARMMLNVYNTNLTDYDYLKMPIDYIDGKTEGVSAYMYVFNSKENLHGIGKF